MQSLPSAVTPSQIIVQDQSSISHLMDTARFDQVYRIAQLMAQASLIPDHLKMDPRTKAMLPAETIAANCFMIVNQAFRWDFDPFNVAPETYMVGGKLGFQGKLVAAAVNARAGLEERLSYEYEGKPGTDEFAVVVSGRIKGETKPRTVRVSVGQAKTANEMWRKDPEQKLMYTGAIKWARRHTPEIILGVLLEDEIDPEPMRDVTPPKEKLAQSTNPYTEEPKAKNPAPPKEEPAAKEEPADEEHPPRVEMVKDIKATWKEAKVTMPQAEDRYKANGLVPEGSSLSSLSDAEVATIWHLKEKALIVEEKGGDKQ